MRFQRMVLVATVAALCSCGGGGGGGGGGSSSHGVRVLHAGLDFAPADLTSSAVPGVVLSSTTFGAQAGYVEVPDGQQLLTLTVRAGAGAASTSATVTGNDKFSLLLFEGGRTGNPAVSLITDLVPELEESQAAIRVVNGVNFSSTFDIQVNGSSLPGGAVPSQGSAYQTVVAGPTTVAVRSNGATIYSGTLNLGPGTANTLLLAGEQGYFVGGRLLLDN